MDKLKQAFRALVRGRLIVEGKGRTTVCVPLWACALAVLLARRGLTLVALTALGIMALGMRVRIDGMGGDKSWK